MKKSSQSTSIKVACRLRPLNQLELSTGGACCLTYTDKAIKVKVTGEDNPHEFTFDHIFGPETSQGIVYDKVAMPVLNGLIEGYNGTVFAYGQTSSGKTFTMEGPDIVDTEEKKGIIPRMMSHLFELIMNSSENIEFNVKVSFLELYNEKLHDLLDPRKTNLQIKEDKARGIFIQDVTEIYVSSPEQMRQVHKKGAENRTVAATRMNERSSRSHSIFILTLMQKDLSTEAAKHSKLYFVDLAGSEKIAKTHVTGQQLEEAKNINKSLSALGLVINALTDKKENAHVPYRDSKLTRLLQESLGGNSQTSLILACSMCSYNDKETLGTLRFGNRAKNIKNAPVVNVERSAKEYMAMLDASERKIKDQENIIQRLQQQLEAISQGNNISFTTMTSEPENLIQTPTDIITEEVLGDETPKTQKEEKEKVEVKAEEKPKAKAAKESGQPSSSLMLLKQQIELANLTEELQELQKINKELEKEVSTKNQEIYNLNGKVMTYEHQMNELTKKNIEALEDFRTKYDKVCNENQENAIVMSKYMRALNRLKSDLHFLYISKNLTMLDIAEKGSVLTTGKPVQDTPQQKQDQQMNKEDLIINSIQKTIEMLDEIEKDLTESEKRKPPQPKDTEALLEFLLKDSEPNSSKKLPAGGRKKSSFPKNQSEHGTNQEGLTYNSDEELKPSRLATDDSSDEMEQSIDSIDSLTADIEPLEASEDFTDDFLSIASDDNKVNELQKLITAQRQSIRNLSKFNSEIMQASEKSRQMHDKKVEGYLSKIDILEKAYNDKIAEYDEKIAALKKLLEEKIKEVDEVRVKYDKDALDQSKVISDLRYQNERMQKIILGNDLPKRVFDLEQKLREIALDRQNLFEDVFKLRKDVDEKEDQLSEKLTQIQLLQSNINTLSTEVEILKQFRPRPTQNLLIKKRETATSELYSAASEESDTPQWMKEQVLVPNKHLIKPIRGGGGNAKNFERDNFLVFEKPTVLTNTSFQGHESQPSEESFEEPNTRKLEPVERMQKATKKLSEMLKSDKGRKSIFRGHRLEGMAVKPTLNDSSLDQKVTEDNRNTPKTAQEGQSSIKTLFSGVKNLFS